MAEPWRKYSTGRVPQLGRNRTEQDYHVPTWVLVACCIGAAIVLALCPVMR